jgi:hypothetical protein
MSTKAVNRSVNESLILIGKNSKQESNQSYYMLDTYNLFLVISGL